MGGRYYRSNRDKKSLYIKDYTDANVKVIIHNDDCSQITDIHIPMRELCNLIWWCDFKIHDYVTELET